MMEYIFTVVLMIVNNPIKMLKVNYEIINTEQLKNAKENLNCVS